MRFSFYDSSMFAALVEAMQELDYHYFGEKAGSTEFIQASLERGLLAPDSGVSVVVALDQNHIAALATVSLLYPAPEQRPQLFMKDLFVRQAWRGQGLGESFMRFLAQYAISKNCIRFDWTTEENNPQAMAFYERLGARRVREKVYYRLTGSAIAELATGGPGSAQLEH